MWGVQSALVGIFVVWISGAPEAVAFPVPFPSEHAQAVYAEFLPSLVHVFEGAEEKYLPDGESGDIEVFDFPRVREPAQEIALSKTLGDIGRDHFSEDLELASAKRFSVEGGEHHVLFRHFEMYGVGNGPEGCEAASYIRFASSHVDQFIDNVLVWVYVNVFEYEARPVLNEKLKARNFLLRSNDIGLHSDKLKLLGGDLSGLLRRSGIRLDMLRLSVGAFSESFGLGPQLIGGSPESVAEERGGDGGGSRHHVRPLWTSFVLMLSGMFGGGFLFSVGVERMRRRNWRYGAPLAALGVCLGLLLALGPMMGWIPGWR